MNTIFWRMDPEAGRVVVTSRPMLPIRKYTGVTHSSLQRLIRFGWRGLAEVMPLPLQLQLCAAKAPKTMLLHVYTTGRFGPERHLGFIRTCNPSRHLILTYTNVGYDVVKDRTVPGPEFFRNPYSFDPSDAFINWRRTGKVRKTTAARAQAKFDFYAQLFAKDKLRA